MMNIGGRIRSLRLQQGRTLQDIAGHCGFTSSLLSKIETGKSIPPIATLMKIAGSLGVRVSAFLDETVDVGTVFTEAGRTTGEKMVHTEKGYSFYLFAHERPDKSFQPYLFTARRDEIVSTPLSHEGEEYIYLLEGRMRYRVGTAEYILNPGDSLYFDSEQEHDLLPLSAEVRYLAIFSERSLKKDRDTETT